jgi:hypothetical protein
MEKVLKKRPMIKDLARMKRFSSLGQKMLAVVCGAIVLSGAVVLRSAQACTYPHGMCNVTNGMNLWWQTQPDFNETMKQFFENDFYQNRIVDDFFQNYILDQLFNNNIRPALENMTAQLVAARTFTAGMVGAMIDGKVTLDYQLEMQTLHARAIKDYMPGENLCRFGSGVRSLGAAEQRSVANYMALADISQNRQLGTRGGTADAGSNMDRTARVNQFRRVYCNPADNNGDLGPLCLDTGGATLSNPQRFNKDVNYTRTIDQRQTLDVDYAGYDNGTPANSNAGRLTPDEEDVLALQSNLYGHDVFSRLTKIAFDKIAKNQKNQLAYMDLRQVVAVRNVAVNSFNTIAAMRARGGPGAATYLQNVLRNIGMSAPEAARYLSANGGEPSYYAQMNVLTKKLYQDPNFYVNLIDKPANIDRQTAAMQAFGLMQDRDLYQSLSRQEMLLAMILELRVRAEQDNVQRAKGIIKTSP